MSTIFQLPSGKWCCRVRSCTPHRSATFPTKALAEQWGRKIEGDIAHGRAGVIPPRLTWNELIERYELEMQTVREFGKNKKAVLGYFKHWLGDDRVARTDAPRLMHYITAQRRIGGVTAAIDLSYLGGLFRAARTWGYPVDTGILETAREHLKRAGVVTKSMERDRRPTQEELDKLRAWLNVHSRSLRPEMLDFIIDSCFRPPSEITRLRWGDLNEEDKTILIRDRKHPQKKYGNHQTVPLLGRSFEIIMRQPRGGEFIFPLNGKSWSSVFPRACRECGIEDLALYDLRHHAISLLVETGRLSIPQMMLVSGHTDPKTFMRYVQLKAKDLHE